jgi:hypothetical protein
MVDTMKDEFQSTMTNHQRFKDMINFHDKRPSYPPKSKSAER